MVLDKVFNQLDINFFSSSTHLLLFLIAPTFIFFYFIFGLGGEGMLGEGRGDTLGIDAIATPFFFGSTHTPLHREGDGSYTINQVLLGIEFGCS